MFKHEEAVRRNWLLLCAAATICLLNLAAAGQLGASEGCGTYYQDKCTDTYGEEYTNAAGQTCTFSGCTPHWDNGPAVDCHYTCRDIQPE